MPSLNIKYNNKQEEKSKHVSNFFLKFACLIYYKVNVY